MADNYHTLPGGCVVKQIVYNTHGITLTNRLINPFGFEPSQHTTVLVTPGYLVITTRPDLSDMLKGIEELQLRQDEIREDFTDAIKVLLHQFVK